MANDNSPRLLLEFLKRNRENSGVMADLRCALIPAREYRSWQHIARFCDLENDRNRTISAIVCAAFAILLECGKEQENRDGKEFENMGDVLRRIARGDHNKDGLSSFELRFKRLLACDTVEELAPQLHSIFKAAKAAGISINYENLRKDLCSWGIRVKRCWASHFHRESAREEEQKGANSNE